jgi:hypothetical protein
MLGMCCLRGGVIYSRLRRELRPAASLAAVAAAAPNDALAVHGQQLMHALRIRWAVLWDSAAAACSVRADLACVPAHRCSILQRVHNPREIIRMLS